MENESFASVKNMATDHVTEHKELIKIWRHLSELSKEIIQKEWRDHVTIVPLSAKFSVFN